MIEGNFLTIQDNSTNNPTELYMTFILSEKIYAIEAKQIIEILQLPALFIPEKVPEHITGLLNLRGKIISVVDLRKFLGIQKKVYSIEDQILIIEIHNKTFGIIVDFVCDVIQFNRNNLELLPYHSHDNFISGIYKSSDYLAAILNLEIIFNNIEAVQIEESEFQSLEESSLNYFPTDKRSIDKLQKRALNLQKELKFGITKNNYQENNFVSFSLDQEKYCISLKFVKEFCKLKLVNLVPIPCVPEFIVGLINLRGNFITIIDIKAFLQVKKTTITDKTKIIVIKSTNLQIGLIVDEVFDIINIPPEKLSHNSPPKFERNKFTSGEVLIDENSVITILDLGKLLEDERLIVEDAI